MLICLLGIVVFNLYSVLYTVVVQWHRGPTFAVSRVCNEPWANGCGGGWRNR